MFCRIYHRLGLAGRDIATKVSYPLRKKGAGDIAKICMTVRKVWKDVVSSSWSASSVSSLKLITMIIFLQRDIHKELNQKVPEFLESCEMDDLLGFSPVNVSYNCQSLHDK